MKSYMIKKSIIPEKEDLLNLYNDAGWFSYTADPEKLLRGYKNSVSVISAWDNHILTGILRAVGDEETIMYIQDLLVLTAYKRKGIGTMLINTFLEDYKNIRQKVLLSDNNPEATGFYISCGFKYMSEFNGVAFVNYNPTRA